jgi:hypothetical protein
MYIPAPEFPVRPVLTQITELTVGGPWGEAADECDHLIEKGQVDWCVFCTKFETAGFCDGTLLPAHYTN